MMSEDLTPPERDRPPEEVPFPHEPPLESMESSPETSIWTLVGVIVLLAIAAGAIAGFLGGRIFEYSRLSDDEMLGLLGGLPADSGDSVSLLSVRPTGAAAAAGLQEGDSLISIDGERIRDARHARQIVGRYQSGDTVQVAYERNFRFNEVPLVLGSSVRATPTPVVVTVLPPTPAPTNGQGQGFGQENGALGVLYRLDNPLGLGEGAFLVRVTPNGPADLAGIVAGDTIIAVEANRVNAERPLDSVMSRFVSGQTVRVTVLRDGEELPFEVTLGS
jgi:S1-C subfamily serine protease